MAPPRHPLQEGSFDPLALLRRTRNEQDSELRRIMLRMLWLRQRVPDTRVDTTLISLDERALVMSATISVPGGGQGSGHVAIALDDGIDLAAAVEQAETGAIGRALDVLGYVVIEPASSDRSPRPVESPARPVESASPPPTPITREERRSEPPEHIRAIRAMRERDQEPGPSLVDDPPDDASPSTTPAAPPTDRPDTSASPPPPAEADPELEDVSWTAFWGWARSTYQLSSKGQLEDLLGQPIRNETPGQLRQMLNAHFSEDADDET